MKKRILFATILPLLFSSCIKDYYGGGPYEEKIELTSENYLYEGDLYSLFLNSEISKQEVIISDLKNQIEMNQADENTFENLQKAEEQKKTFSSELEIASGLDLVALRIPKPRPPCPNPATCDFSLLNYVLTAESVYQINILIFNSNGKMIGGGKIDELSPLPGTGNLLNFSNLKVEEYDGPIRIEVEVFDEAGKDRAYSIGGN